MQAMIPVLVNDSDCDNNIDPSSLSVISGPSHGAASVFFNTGNIVYMPALNYNGPDTLRYRICDSDNQCDSAFVFITVVPMNDPPRVRNESVSLCENDSVSGNVLTNDADTIENTPMVVRLPPVSLPAHGNLVISSDGFFTYTPDAGYSGPDSFIVSACDSGYPLPALCFPDTVFITVEPTIEAIAGPDQQVCDATTVTLAGNSPLPGTGQWMQVSGPNPAAITPSGLSGAIVSGLVPGLYAFSYTITNVDCGSSDTLTVLNVSPLPPAFAGNDQDICLTGATASTHLASATPPAGTGKWSQQQGPTTALIADPFDPNTLVSNLITGVYRFTWTVTNNNCPAVSDSVLVSVFQSSTASAGVDHQICGTETFSITGSAAMNYQALHWSTSGTGTFDDATLLHPLYTPGANDISAGSVHLILTTTSLSNCPSMADTMLLTISKPPAVNAGPDGSTCTTIPYSISGAQISDADSISWTHNGQGQLAGSTTLSPVYTPAPGENGLVTFTLKARGQGGCMNLLAGDDCLLQIFLPVTADAGADQSISAETSATLNAFVSLGSGNYLYIWEPAGLLENNSLPEVVTVPLDSSSTFYLEVRDTVSGCSAGDSVRVTVKTKPVTPEEECFEIRNVITPNGDGANDTWIIDCIEKYPFNKMLIFDRWGDKVREIENYNNTTRAWDGTNQQGNVVPDGTYYYVLSVQNGQPIAGWIYVRGGSR